MFRLGQEVVIETSGRKRSSRLLGWRYSHGKKYLLVEIPMEKKGFQPPNQGEPAILRLEAEGNHIGLGAIYAETLKKTGLMLFLIGKEVVMKQMREHARFRCCIPVNLMAATGEPSQRGNIFDISTGGIGFTTQNNLEIETGGKLMVSFPIVRMGSVSMASLKITRIRSAGLRFEYAGMFMDLNNDNSSVIGNYIRFCVNWKPQ